MPEGPSIVILRDAVQFLAGKKIIRAEGSALKTDFGRLLGTKIIAFKSWGKHLLICLPGFTVRIHLLMFGSYSIDTPKPNRVAKLSMYFTGSKSLHFYACSIAVIEQQLKDVYDLSADVMNKMWDSKKALAKINEQRDSLVCDVLLDQAIFAGVGNIIKNEVLFRVKIHPNSIVGKIPSARRKMLINEAVRYSFQFLEWKKENTLKRHWLAYAKKSCPRDHAPLRKEYLGKKKRRTFYCAVCQKLYR